MSVYLETKLLAEKALEGFLNAEQKESASAKDIGDYALEHFRDEYDAVHASWGSYLTKASRDESSRIRRLDGRFGYVLKSNENAVDEVFGADENDGDLSSDAEPVRTGNEQRERCLYSLLVDWLRSEGYNAKDTSKNKKGGTWGNPDVTGLLITERLVGNREVEVATVEAKISQDNWKKDFFEAVSHKRFADRVYFVFAMAAENPVVSSVKNFDEMREYGERFGVGISVIFLEPSNYEKLTVGSVSSLDFGIADARIENIWPATYDSPPHRRRDEYIRNVLELRTEEDAILFGRD
jgi:hypothetical protein